MRFKLEITGLGNAAFGDEGDDYTRNMEVARLLSEASGKVAGDQTEGVLMDINGNRVGTWGFTR